MKKSVRTIFEARAAMVLTFKGWKPSDGARFAGPQWHGVYDEAMWKEHVVIEDEAVELQRLSVAAGAAPLALKTMQMVFFYTILAICAPLALSAVGVGTPHERGVSTLLALWLCHVDAASWRPTGARRATAWSRRAAWALSAAEGRPGLCMVVALAPLGYGLVAVPWTGMEGGAARFARDFFLWINALGMLSSWAAMVAPSKLASMEASSGGKLSRMVKVACLSAWPFAFSLFAWTMFSKVAGF